MTAPPADDRPQPPDLQELVARFGGYHKITLEAWAEYDRAVAQWQYERRLGLPGFPQVEKSFAGHPARRAARIRRS